MTGQNQANVRIGPINSLVRSICLGLLAGFSGSMYHVYIWYVSDSFFLPWGALLAMGLVFCAASWSSLRAGKTWAGTLVGLLAFLLVAFFSFAKSGSVLVLPNPTVPVGLAGTIWLLGTLAATVVSNVTVGRYLAKHPPGL
ncbi:MAG: hypothetical protein Q4C74_08715 [Rothia sp. (in: high G+C Gram-positive bacteria)]|nr:hypothetical protein [Rothia sp. (in: high G+C Gram-positive bacteria)]